MKVYISDAVKYIGADDKNLDLFESQYPIPNGISYNSYVIIDEKIAVMDTIDKRKTDEWINNLEEALDGRIPDYLVISHLEPDHASNIKLLADKYPSMLLVGNVKTFNMLPLYFDIDLSDRKVVVAQGDTLELGGHTLKFIMAPMVHWPEVMMEYELSEKILFSADGFGKFGALDIDEDWACEARRYYFNIVGKYGAQVQAVLKKAAGLDIRTICPLHGPILRENIGYYINLYDIWSKYQAETDGVFIAYCSIHGNTKDASLKLYDILKSKTDKKITISDLSREDLAECVEDAFRYSKMIVAAPTYDAGVFPVMNDFLYHLKIKSYKNRTVGIIENGSWAPISAKIMKSYFEEMKDIEVIPETVSLKGALKDSDISALEKLADAILG